MDWRWKARIVKLIAALPMSNALYYRMQRNFGSLRRGKYDPSERLRAAAKMVGWAEESGHPIEGRSVLEVGTGRTIDIPLALWLCGAARVLTVDLNPYLVEELTRESVTFLCRPENITKIFGGFAERPLFRERLARLRQFDGRLADLMRLTDVQYVAPADASHLTIPSGSIDVHVSFTVLEHIPPDVLASILKEARRVLAPGGLLLHIIDPSDHFSHDDGSITAVNFLQFSDREWTRLAANQFMFHNRLRAYEYVELFTRAGVRILGRRDAVDERSLKALQNGFRLDERFRHIALEQLAIRSIILLGEYESAEHQQAPSGLAGSH